MTKATGAVPRHCIPHTVLRIVSYIVTMFVHYKELFTCSQLSVDPTQELGSWLQTLVGGDALYDQQALRSPQWGSWWASE